MQHFIKWWSKISFADSSCFRALSLAWTLNFLSKLPRLVSQFDSLTVEPAWLLCMQLSIFLKYSKPHLKLLPTEEWIQKVNKACWALDHNTGLDLRQELSLWVVGMHPSSNRSSNPSPFVPILWCCFLFYFCQFREGISLQDVSAYLRSEDKAVLQLTFG